MAEIVGITLQNCLKQSKTFSSQHTDVVETYCDLWLTGEECELITSYVVFVDEKFVYECRHWHSTGMFDCMELSGRCCDGTRKRPCGIRWQWYSKVSQITIDRGRFAIIGTEDLVWLNIIWMPTGTPVKSQETDTEHCEVVAEIASLHRRFAILIRSRCVDLTIDERDHARVRDCVVCAEVYYDQCPFRSINSSSTYSRLQRLRLTAVNVRQYVGLSGHWLWILYHAK